MELYIQTRAQRMLCKHSVCVCIQPRRRRSGGSHVHAASENDQSNKLRVSEEDWLAIERAAADCGDKPPDWCRTLALEAAKMPLGMTPNDRLLFSQVCRNLFLVESGFTLLAEDTFESEYWERHRSYAKENFDTIANRAVEEFKSKTEHERRQ